LILLSFFVATLLIRKGLSDSQKTLFRSTPETVVISQNIQGNNRKGNINDLIFISSMGMQIIKG